MHLGILPLKIFPQRPTMWSLAIWALKPIRNSMIIKSVGTAPQQIALTPQEDTLEEVVVQSNPFKTTKETPLSTQTFSAVEIETYPGGNNDITKVVQSMPGYPLLLEAFGMILLSAVCTK